MGRSPCCEKVGLKKGPWTPEEDQKLLAYIEEHGHGSWRALPAKAELQRCGKSCRLRWTNYLRPDIKRGKFSLQEEQTIIQLHALLGNRWSAIATHLPKRTDNEIKNYWNTYLKKRLAKMGIDPVTHKPKNDALGGPGDGQSKSAANLSHMAQWESARLEAEARLVRESKLRSASASTPPPFHSHQQLHDQLGSSSAAPPLVLPTHQLHDKPAPHAPPLPCLDVLRAWQGVWPKPAAAAGQACAGGIALESPTSTLSFSENNVMQPAVTSTGLIEHSSSAAAVLCGHQVGEELDGDHEVEWKCFSSKQTRNINTAAVKYRMESFAHFSMDSSSVFGGETSWISESSRIGTGTAAGDYGVGFTGMLLDNSDDQTSLDGCCDSDNNAEGGSCVEEEEEGEDGKNYWNSILNLVNSSSPSNSPPVF